MKRIVAFALLLIMILAIPAAIAGEKISPDCTFNGKKLYGKVRFVQAFADVKVQVVTGFPDLKVKMVNAFPDSCGKWQAVDSFEDLKVQIVEGFPDIKIQFVEAFPGQK